MVRFGAAFLGLTLVWMTGVVADDRLPESLVGDNGLHTQNWFHDGFLELADDLSEAAETDKDLLVLIEQPGCPYCRELHDVNLRIRSIVETMKENYLVVQLDMRGSREVIDLDGEVLEERKLVRKWGVNFTPTMIFIPADAIDGDGDGKSRSVMMMPGYFKPFHFDTMLNFIASDSYQNGGDFQRYLDVRVERLRKEGKDVTIW